MLEKNILIVLRDPFLDNNIIRILLYSRSQLAVQFKALHQHLLTSSHFHGNS